LHCKISGGHSFDHLVGAHQKRLGNFQPNGLGRRQIEDQFELRRLLDGNLRRLGPTQDLVDEIPGAPEQICVVRSVGKEPPEG
jgi:hypothetical protein